MYIYKWLNTEIPLDRSSKIEDQPCFLPEVRHMSIFKQFLSLSLFIINSPNGQNIDTDSARV